MKNLLSLGLFQHAFSRALHAAEGIAYGPTKRLIHKQGLAENVSDSRAALAYRVVQKKPVRGQKNMTLRVHPKTGAVELRAPRRASRADVDRFLFDHQSWVHERLAEIAPAIPFKAGIEIPFLGQPRLVRQDPTHKRGVRDNGTELLVGVGDALVDGRLDTELADLLLEKRLRAFLVARARREVTMRAKYYASQLSKRVTAITVRDMHARWGSCAKDPQEHGARLSFSWRLVLTPLFVLDYVVAHECAHCVHMDHSPAFWGVVESLVGDYQTAEAWLNNQGQSIIRIG